MLLGLSGNGNENAGENNGNNATPENEEVILQNFSIAENSVKADPNATAIESLADGYKAEAQRRIEEIENYTQISDDDLFSLKDSSEYFTEGNKLFTSNSDVVSQDDFSKYVVKENTSLSAVPGSTSKEDYILVVDENAYVLYIKDKDGKGIGDATVTIQYKDGEVSKTKYAKTSNTGSLKGIVAFPDLKGTHDAYIDVYKDGYHAVTMLCETITGGESRTIVLETAKQNEVYIRGADMSGKYLNGDETELILAEGNSENLDLSFILSATGNAKLPGSIELYSKTDGRTITTINLTKQDSDNNTGIYSLERTWIRKDYLLKNKDKLAIRFAGYDLALEHVTAKNAVCEGSFVENLSLVIQEPESTEDAPAKIKKYQFVNGNVDLGTFKVSVGRLANGNFFIMGQLDWPLDKYNYNTLFKDCNPRKVDKVKGLMSGFKTKMAQNLENLSSGSNYLMNQHDFYKTSALTWSLNFSLYYSGFYNEEANRYEGDFLGGVTGGVDKSFTYYSIVYAGPVAFPVYYGFHAGGTVSGKLDMPLTATSIIPLKGIAVNAKTGAQFDISVAPYFGAYFGAGIRGLLGADIEGSVSANLFLGFNFETDVSNHYYMDVTGNLKMNYYYLAGSGSVSLLNPSEAWRVFEEPKSSTVTLSSSDYTLEWKSFDLADMTENLSTASNSATLATTNEDKTVNLATYKTSASNKLLQSSNDTQTIVTIDTDTYSDNQPQMVTSFKVTKNADKTETFTRITALFRTIVKDGKIKLVYQLQDTDSGVLDSTLHEVDIPDGYSVFEYKVVGNATRYATNAYNSYAYIGAVVGDESKTTSDERSDSTEVYGIVVDLDTGKQIRTKKVSPDDESNPHYYFNPLPAGSYNDICVSYSRSNSPEEKSEQYDNILNGIVISQNVPVYCNNVYTTQSAYFTIDPDKSSNTTLAIKGYKGDYTGKSEDTIDEFTIDIGENTTGNDYPITNWIHFDKYEFILANGKVYYYYHNINQVEGGQLSFWQSWRDDGAIFVGDESTYQVFADYINCSIYLVATYPIYKIGNDGKQTFDGTEVEISTIYDDTQYNGLSLHGTKRYFISNEKFDNYAVSFSSASSHNGLTIAYNKTDDNGDTNLYQWLENAKDGFVLEDFHINSSVVTNTEKYISATVTYRNVGYSKLGSLAFKVTDNYNSGTTLDQYTYSSVDHTYTKNDGVYSHDIIYPNDAYTFIMYLGTNQAWGSGVEYEPKEVKITCQITSGGADSNSLSASQVLKSYDYDVININDSYEDLTYNSSNGSITQTFDDPYLTMSGYDDVENGNHVARLQISNSSVIVAKNPKIKLTVINDDSTTSELKTISFTNYGTSTSYEINDSNDHDIKSSDGSYSKSTYNFIIDLEDEFESLDKEKAMAIQITLVGSDGKSISNDKLTMFNPYYVATITTDSGSGSDDSSSSDDVAATTEVKKTTTVKKVTTETIIKNLDGTESRKINVKGNSDVYVLGNSKYIPTGAVFASNEIASTSEEFKAVKELVEKLDAINIKDYFAYDMTLTKSDDTEIHQLDGYVEVTLPVPENIKLNDNQHIVAYRVNDDNTLTKCETDTKDGVITFKTDHFSTYIFIVEEDTASIIDTVENINKDVKESIESNSDSAFITIGTVLGVAVTICVVVLVILIIRMIRKRQ